MKIAEKILIHSILLAVICTACSEYTPKPRGFYRIELEPPHYRELSEEIDSLTNRPYSFKFSQQAQIDSSVLLQAKDNSLILSYPAFNTKLYCNFFTTSSKKHLEILQKESRSLVVRHTKNIKGVKEQEYENKEQYLSGSLFLLDEESSSPFQFMLTDGNRRFFRGAFYYDFVPNADSIAPIRQYLQQEVHEIIQSFHWEH